MCHFKRKPTHLERNKGKEGWYNKGPVFTNVCFQSRFKTTSPRFISFLTSFLKILINLVFYLTSTSVVYFLKSSPLSYILLDICLTSKWQVRFRIKSSFVERRNKFLVNCVNTNSWKLVLS